MISMWVDRIESTMKVISHIVDAKQAATVDFISFEKYMI